MNQEASIELRNLSIGYRSKGNEKQVAHDISATIYSGELTCLLGRNGIGKSTLLRTLSAFQPPLGGQILIGYTGFWGGLTAADEEVVSDALQLVGIVALEQRLVHTLSDGERQKVMIAKSLAQQTPVIYLDEPTAFLDFPSKVDTMQLLGRLAHEQGKTIFLSTHDVELALQLADRIWLMLPDHITIGTPRQLADDGTLSLFIERDGIAFDAQSLTIHVKQNRTL